MSRTYVLMKDLRPDSENIVSNRKSEGKVTKNNQTRIHIGARSPVTSDLVSASINRALASAEMYHTKYGIDSLPLRARENYHDSPSRRTLRA